MMVLGGGVARTRVRVGSETPSGACMYMAKQVVNCRCE